MICRHVSWTLMCLLYAIVTKKYLNPVMTSCWEFLNGCRIGNPIEWTLWNVVALDALQDCL